MERSSFLISLHPIPSGQARKTGTVSDMKEVIAIIRTDAVESTKNVLESVGIKAMTFADRDRAGTTERRDPDHGPRGHTEEKRWRIYPPPARRDLRRRISRVGPSGRERVRSGIRSKENADHGPTGRGCSTGRPDSHQSKPDRTAWRRQDLCMPSPG